MYVIQFPADGTKVWVPTIAAQEQGMRKVMNAKKVEETYSAIRRQALGVLQTLANVRRVLVPCAGRTGDAPSRGAQSEQVCLPCSIPRYSLLESASAGATVMGLCKLLGEQLRCC